jgi:deoxyribodipyrimidine photo-lyase
MSFPTDYEQILERIESVDPVKYGRTRNFQDGAVTRLSPYISRGMISTKQVMENVLARGYSLSSIEKFIQELAWRDYWQQVWIAKGDAINDDLRHPQPDVRNCEIATAISKAQTGIEAIDAGITELYHSGYMHNHMRMYVAAVACNMAKSHWREPARWMYYHLLDGDWACNALSWQWVAGSNANKKYVANQENINKYFNSNQKGTFLDVPYSAFSSMEIPEVLKEKEKLELKIMLPESDELIIDESQPTLVYNYYNLDPKWHEGESANRILLLEPSVFERYPISEKALNFALALSKNIEGIQVFVGEFHELKERFGASSVFFKEHPFNTMYKGTEEPRDWLFSVTGYHRSFFAFWKNCQKELENRQTSLF